MIESKHFFLHFFYLVLVSNRDSNVVRNPREGNKHTCILTSKTMINYLVTKCLQSITLSIMINCEWF